MAIGRATIALAFPQHFAQAIHHLVVGIVERIAACGQQFHRLADAGGLVDGALLADRQVHGQVQEGVAAGGVGLLHVAQGGVHIGQGRVELRMFFHPQLRQRLDRFHGLVGLPFAVNGAEEAANVGLGGGKHGKCRGGDGPRARRLRSISENRCKPR